MLYAIVVATVAPACGNDIGIEVDAAGGGPPGSPLVTVTSPRSNESFYPSQTAQIQWTATDDDSAMVTCDVAAIAGTNRIAIMAGTTQASGQLATVTWTLASVTPADYRVEVTCTDRNGLAGVGVSAAFAVSPPAQMVSFATVNDIFKASCTSMACHDSTQPAGTLDLTATRAYAALVNVASGDCPATLRVKPGAPDQSYLVHKLQGSGPCFVGSRMPKAAPALSAAQIRQIRDWIATGAPST